MSVRHTKTTTAAFLGGYLVAYFGSLRVIIALLSDRITASWIFLGSDAWKVRLISVIAPVIAVIVGTFTASVTLIAAETRGSDRMRPWQFFKTGWISMVLANVIVHCTAFKVFIPIKEGEQWLKHIDQVTYNGCVFLLSPTVGFIGASFAVFLTQAIIDAQNG